MILLVAAALAGPTPSGTLARQALAAEPQGGAVLACSSLAPVLRTLASVPLPPSLLGEAGPKLASLARLLRPEVARGAGLDVEGGFTVVGGEDGATAGIPFIGDDAQLRVLLEAMFDEVHQEVGQWQVTDGDDPGTVRRVPAGVELRLGEVRSPEGAPARVRALLDGLPDAQGCTLALYDEEGPKDQPFAMGVLIPFKGAAPLTVRMDSPAAPPPAVLASGGRLPLLPPLPATPTAVGGLSIPLDALLDYAAADAGLSVPDLVKLRQHVRFPSGVAIAVFRTGGKNQILGALPVQDGAGAPMKARRAMRFLRQMESDELKVISRDRFQMAMKDEVLFGRVLRGVVVVTNESALLEGIDGPPVAWISETGEVWARRWPIFVVTPDGADFQARLGIRADGSAWELAAELRTATPIQPEMMGMIAGMALAGAGANFERIATKARATEGMTRLEAIRVAELSYDAAFDAFVATPTAPRPVEALDKEAVEWVTTPEWQTLGYQPDERVRCTYRVDLTPGGTDFLAWAHCDVDGDGVPAVFRASSEEPPVRVTPEGVE